MKPYAFGIDIGGTTVKIGLFKTEGNLLEKWEIPTRVEENGSRIIPDIADAVNGKMQDRKMQPERSVISKSATTRSCSADAERKGIWSSMLPQPGS